MATQPDEMVLAYGDVSSFKYPLPTLLNASIANMTTDWIWRLDVDDLALRLPTPKPVVDVVVSAYTNPDGSIYLPPELGAAQYLAGFNTIPGASLFRRSTFLEVGGYPEIGFEDWGLWRRFARAGAWFGYDPEPTFVYEPGDRTNDEFSQRQRKIYFEELMRECP